MTDSEQSGASSEGVKSMHNDSMPLNLETAPVSHVYYP